MPYKLMGFVPLSILLLALLSTPSFASSTHTHLSQQHLVPCSEPIIMTTGNGLFQIPTTFVKIPSCILSFLVLGGDPTTIQVSATNTIPSATISLLKQTIAFHAEDFWQKDRTCSPQHGIVFHIFTPTLWTLLFTPVPISDLFLLIFPSTSCL